LRASSTTEQGRSLRYSRSSFLGKNGPFHQSTPVLRREGGNLFASIRGRGEGKKRKWPVGEPFRRARDVGGRGGEKIRFFKQSDHKEGLAVAWLKVWPVFQQGKSVNSPAFCLGGEKEPVLPLLTVVTKEKKGDHRIEAPMSSRGGRGESQGDLDHMTDEALSEPRQRRGKGTRGAGDLRPLDRKRTATLEESTDRIWYLEGTKEAGATRPKRKKGEPVCRKLEKVAEGVPSPRPGKRKREGIVRYFPGREGKVNLTTSEHFRVERGGGKVSLLTNVLERGRKEEWGRNLPNNKKHVLRGRREICYFLFRSGRREKGEAA